MKERTILFTLVLAELAVIFHTLCHGRKQKRRSRKLELELNLLKVKSKIDPLTGVYHKIAAEDLVKDVIRKSKPSQMHALLIIDIDDFKQINDTYGHRLGDKVLIHVIAHIRKLFETNDIVGRIGGDEFLVFLRHVKSKEEVSEKSAGIFTAFHQSRHLEKGKKVTVTGSIGASLYPKDGTSFEELMQKADQALYKGKASGKNQIQFYSSRKSKSSAIYSEDLDLNSFSDTMRKI